MTRKELLVLTARAALVALIAAPLAMLGLVLFGVDPEIRAPIVASITAAVTVAVARRRPDVERA